MSGITAKAKAAREKQARINVLNNMLFVVEAHYERFRDLLAVSVHAKISQHVPNRRWNDYSITHDIDKVGSVTFRISSILPGSPYPITVDAIMALHHWNRNPENEILFEQENYRLKPFKELLSAMRQIARVMAIYVLNVVEHIDPRWDMKWWGK